MLDPGCRWRNFTWQDATRLQKVSNPIGDTSYTYDASGSLIRQTDAANQRLCFYYDTAGCWPNGCKGAATAPVLAVPAA